MEYTATNGKDTIPVRIYHWWPNRKYRGDCPLPDCVLELAGKYKAQYVTMAATTIILDNIGEGLMWNAAFCSRKDTPSKKLGRHIACSRLDRDLETYGWRVKSNG